MNPSDKKIITFIGGGNIVRAFLTGLRNKDAFGEDLYHVIDPDEAKRNSLQDDFGIKTFASISTYDFTKTHCIILAFKPQQLKAIGPSLGRTLESVQPLIISFLAGVGVATIVAELSIDYPKEGGYGRSVRNHQSYVIRAMPNTPMQVNRGVIALYVEQNLLEKVRPFIEGLFATLGKTLWLQDEDQMHVITAFSGSGPAYVFYLLEGLQKLALELGLNHEQAELLTIETFLGASLTAKQSDLLPAQLKRAVMSPGGVTECAIQSMAQSRISENMAEAIKLAIERSKELARKA